jgi:DNA-binding NtrC family response regulator
MRAPVLVVDDEPMVRRSLARAIERTGLEVVTTGGGAEALAKLGELHCRALFTDLRMPGMDGLSLLRSVKQLAPDTQVVLVTGFGSEEVIDRARAEGASHVLAKPFTLSEVEEVLSSIFGPAPTGGRGPVLLTENPRMEAVLALARRVAQTEATVLIRGATGTGKEVLARMFHQSSGRAKGPFVAVNCSALPESLIEVELFGHERGAFTGATGRRAGRFEAASGGTLFLDEVTEIPVGVQAKLLRALQEREVERVGSSYVVKVDVRVIATTNRDLRAEVLAGRFRQDLFYRLNVVSFHLPRLANRQGDIPVLARHFLQRYAAEHGSRAERFAPAALERLLAYSWPGNIRELENVIQRAVIFCTGREITADEILLEDESVVSEPAPDRGPAAVSGTVAAVEKDLILSTLYRLGGNRTHTAKALGVSVRTIRNRLHEYRLTS